MINRDLNIVHPFLRNFVELSMKIADKYNLPFFVFETARTVERYLQIYPKLNPDDIYPSQRFKHMIFPDGYCRAVDIVLKNDLDQDGDLDWDWTKEHVYLYEMFSIAVKNEIDPKILGFIRWGGDWRMKDYPHWEIVSLHSGDL